MRRITFYLQLGTFCVMIFSYQHKGLALYSLNGGRSKLYQPHVQKIKTILTRLEVAKNSAHCSLEA